MPELEKLAIAPSVICDALLAEHRYLAGYAMTA